MTYTWSWTGLSTFRQCPLQFEQTVLTKKFVRAPGPALERGSKIHESLALWVASRDDDVLASLALPAASHMKRLVEQMHEVMGPPRVECSVAVDVEWRPCDFFAEEAWGRGLIDVIWHAKDVAVVLDWKTGSSAADTMQLRLLSYLALAHLPEVDVVRSAFYYVDQPDRSKMIVKLTVDRSEFTQAAAEGVRDLDTLYTAIETGSFEPKPGKHCNWCPVETCRFFKKRLGLK